MGNAYLFSFKETGAPRIASSLLKAFATNADAEALLFSAKTFLAAMLAYAIALRIGLPKPYWAILTVYVVSQTSAGASLSRGVYRLAGTVVGAVATVAIVPNFVNEPTACSMVLAGWIGLCLFLSLLDRTPRAYAFVLAGYTASLIGFPSVTNPGAVFETASLRVQEISLGILCAVLVHRCVLPKPMTGQFTAKLAATLCDARQLARDALDGSPGQQDRFDRHRLAADLLTLQGLATHLPYDPAPTTPRAETLQRMHDRLARLLPLATEIEERIQTLWARAAPSVSSPLLANIDLWMQVSEATERDRLAPQLLDDARSLQAQLRGDAATPDDWLAANLAGHLAEMIGLLHDCDLLWRDLAAANRPRDAAGLAWPRSAARGYVYHRDPLMAAWAALGAVLGIVLGCAFWIWTGWPDGGLAVSVLGVACALFGNADAPAANVVKYLIGTIYGVAVSFLYSFVILPCVTEFAVLVAVLAPVFLFAGSLQARPPTAFKALGITLTVPILAGLGATYAGDFAGSLNAAVALLLAVGFSVVSMALFQTIPVDTAINRLLRVSRRDVGRRALGGAPDEAHWTSLMIDRTALLLPRMQLSQPSRRDVLDETLHHLRLGHAAGRLRKALPYVEEEIASAACALLSAVAAGLGSGRQAMALDLPGLVQRAEALMAQVTSSAMADRSRLLDPLIDLRFALEATGSVTSERGA